MINVYVLNVICRLVADEDGTQREDYSETGKQLLFLHGSEFPVVSDELDVRHIVLRESGYYTEMREKPLLFSQEECFAMGFTLGELFPANQEEEETTVAEELESRIGKDGVCVLGYGDCAPAARITAANYNKELTQPYQYLVLANVQDEQRRCSALVMNGFVADIMDVLNEMELADDNFLWVLYMWDKNTEPEEPGYWSLVDYSSDEALDLTL